MEEPAKPLVCVDLDGVLNLYDGWRDPEFFHPPRPGAREFLQRLNDAGFAVVVFTVRYGPWVERWLAEHGLSPLIREVTDRKPPAHVYLDDRAICFRGDFRRALQQIIDFRAHWEEGGQAGADAGLPIFPAP